MIVGSFCKKFNLERSDNCLNVRILLDDETCQRRWIPLDVMAAGMHVMYTESQAQYRSSQPTNAQPEYQPAVSPARLQPAKKRRVLSPQHYNTQQQHTFVDNTGYKVMKTVQRNYDDDQIIVVSF
ncbi:hypothetical protein O3G_MSEX001197 [Manduca sexta]|uniref:Uncharacterized protein n=1 Tax=Manduca sexta TaxID=7130 RepID=A0A921YJF5_MANSE|nr:hypothetical protein O3G_MSEX001197 [Manduca sexta]